MIFNFLKFKSGTEPPKCNYFGQIITMMKWCGVLIEDIEDPIEALVFKIYSIFLFVVCVYYYMLAQTIDFSQHLDDLEYSSFSMCYMLSQGCGLIKGTLVIIKRKSISKYLKNLETGLFLPNLERGGTNEYKYINTANKHTSVQAIIIYTLVVVIVTARGISALLDQRIETFFDAATNETVTKTFKVLPYNIYLPFDTQKYYYVAFFYQLFTCNLYGFIIGAVDAMITGVMIHVKAQILILKNSLYNIKERAIKMYQKEHKTNNIKLCDNPIEKVSPEIQKYVTVIVAEIISHHVEMIALIEETEEMFNVLMLVQFMVSLFLMCLQLFQLYLTEVNTGQFYSMICYLMFMLFQLFIFCWNGNELSAESVDIANAAFNTDWIQFDNDSQKSIMLIIMRAQKALSVTAGKFANLSLETYTTILRGSASYYLALRSFSEE